MHRVPVSIAETLGLSPLGSGLSGCLRALAGDGYAPGARFGPSSLALLRPGLSMSLWRGRVRGDRRVPITMLVNRTPADPTVGYSVRRTACLDFRGRGLTYDSHDGTDFALPPGTRILAAGPGTVASVAREMSRGGLVVSVDHGGALITVYAHLARAYVTPGQRVARGQLLGLSGMAGADGVFCSPWLAPHLHFTVLHGGETADPFAAEGEVPLWSGGMPTPARSDDDPDPPAGQWNHGAVQDTIASCRDPALQVALCAAPDPDHQAALTALARRVHRFRFTTHRPLAVGLVRRPWLSQPLHRDDAIGAVFIDDAPRVGTIPTATLRPPV